MPKDTEKASKRAVAKTDEKKKRTKKDPSAPKRGLSAYMFFSQASRAQVKEDNPDATFGKLKNPSLCQCIFISFFRSNR